MKETAAIVFLLMAGMGPLLTALDPPAGGSQWDFRKSPNSGICYEIKTSAWLLGATQAMSPVDDKWCE